MAEFRVVIELPLTTEVEAAIERSIKRAVAAELAELDLRYNPVPRPADRKAAQAAGWKWPPFGLWLKAE
ncbi:hypothetical protein FJW07_31270 [Mesorhizobium sp. B3-1-9]|uniref:hypothetical protein n=1 Tax=Mesorhizobium sp. B3-1-9 TaxID=2589892 RepID=UPI00112AA43E|nr:hypothetical protein [Mesorhizobium sp. B3-1-9]TPI27753.1 hypothetical protein FJW07_31270 [Mesorhizobium sp. B3-1-9]